MLSFWTCATSALDSQRTMDLCAGSELAQYASDAAGNSHMNNNSR